ncbi:LLM class flavin-dependent oxidoreductase [Mycobacterium sp. NAZ190054]|uniref:LLM class flavin-dependent oxidoreductase n=1 Tax=Mycobacterium sp. NAZ190054 TaxID=1747766 RepID=UPI000795D8E4|nr:LLM class flavin-dependent oxidoreductase [Mycobacterium sp. NAZ190054]KWX67209.1 hypothetical protein ASJ79_22505 [Mycobacterium sp. NAZ190054]
MRLAARLGSSLSVGDLIETADQAVDAGIDAIWLNENPFERSACVSAAALGMRHPGLRLGIGSVSVRTRYPAIVAQDAVSADAFLQHPLRLGLGVGMPSEDGRKAMNAPTTSGLRLLEESIGRIRALTAGETVPGWGGPAGGDLGLRVPGRRLPVLVAAMGPKTIALAGRLADGIIFSMGSSVDYLAEAIQLARDANDDGSDDEFVSYLYYGGDVPEDDARVVLAPVVARLLAMSAEHGLDWMRAGVDLGGRDVDELLARIADGADPVDEIPLSAIDALALWGPPQKCVEQLRAYEAAGVTEMALGVGLVEGTAAVGADVAALTSAWRDRA